MATKHQAKLHLLALLVVPFIVFGSTLRNGFVWDDDLHLTLNPHLQRVSADSLGAFWRAPYKGLYIPVTYSTWGLIKAASGSDGPTGFSHPVFHFVNVLAHALNSILVYLILMALVRRRSAALIGALAFSVHPVQVETVAWAAEFRGLYSGMFGLTAIWQYLLAARTGKQAATAARRKLHYGLTLACLALALLAKPTAVVVPLIVVAVDWLVLKRHWRQVARMAAPLFLLAGPFIIITKRAQPDRLLDFLTPLWARPLVASDAFNFYVYKLLLPLKLSASYGRTPESILDQSWIYLTWLGPAAVLIGLWFAWRRQWLPICAGVAVFVIGFLPVSGMIPFDFQNISTVSDRYLYLSMVGIGLLAAWGLSAGSPSRTAVIIAACVLAGWSLLSWRQTFAWADRQSIWLDVIAKYPRQYVPYGNLGALYLERDDYVAAAEQFREAIRYKPNYHGAYGNLGLCLAKLNDPTGAEASFTKAIELQPGYFDGLFNYANFLRLRGRAEEALPLYQRALAQRPGQINTLLNLGLALEALDRTTEAIGCYQQVLTKDPGNPDACINLGNIYGRQQQLDQAMVMFELALQRQPNSATIYNNMGVAYKQNQRLPEAVEAYNRALAVQSGHLAARTNLAIALQLLGRNDESLAQFKIAIDANPNDAESQMNLATAYHRMGRLAEAIAAYDRVLGLKPDHRQARSNRAHAEKALSLQ